MIIKAYRINYNHTDKDKILGGRGDGDYIVGYANEDFDYDGVFYKKGAYFHSNPIEDKMVDGKVRHKYNNQIVPDLEVEFRDGYSFDEPVKVVL